MKNFGRRIEFLLENFHKIHIIISTVSYSKFNLYVKKKIYIIFYRMVREFGYLVAPGVESYGPCGTGEFRLLTIEVRLAWIELEV
jgi:hypothetical protein